NTGWGHACVDLLAEGKLAFPSVLWADLVAVGAAAAVQRCGRPIIEVGLGRTDGTQAAPAQRLPGGWEGAALLKTVFARMGLEPRVIFLLSCAPTLGHTLRQSFTRDPLVFSNSYFVELLQTPERFTLPTDRTL